MSLRLEEFCQPEDPDEVVGLLEKYGEEGLILAGGTFVHGLEARGLVSHVKALIDLRKVGLDTVGTDSGALRIGATTTFAALQQAPAVQEDPSLGAIADALACPPVQIRNTATVGGSVAAASPFFDPPVALMALGAVVTARGRDGTRELGLEEVSAGFFQTSLRPDELLVELRVPQATSRSASGFVKLEANASDLAIVNAAARVVADGGGRCADARVVVGGVAARPVRAPSAERTLEGAELGAEALREAGEAVASDIEPLSDHRASGAYRKAVAGVLVRRALERAVGRLA